MHHSPHEAPDPRAALRAPFAPGGPFEIDRERARKLLGVALRRGGDADLFAEFALGASLVLEEGIVKTASRGVSLGVGIRVRRGYAAGYAYTEDLEWESLVRCAETAAQIAEGDALAVAAITERAHPDRYRVDDPSVLAAGTIKRDLLLAADRAARAADSRVQRVEASFAESFREILVATSDGRFVRDVQPMLRFGVRAIAEHDGARRQAGSSGGGGRFGMEYFDQPDKSPDAHAREAVRVALAMLDAREAPAGEMEVVLAPGDSGILLHEAVGHGLEADFNRKGVSNYSGRVGTPVASGLCTVVDRADLDHERGSINVDDEGNTGTSATLIEGGPSAGTSTTSSRRSTTALDADGQRAPRELPLRRRCRA